MVWLEKDSEKGYGARGQFTHNEAVRHGLELAAYAMRKAGASNKKIFDELALQCEGEGIPESIIMDAANGNYQLFRPREKQGGNNEKLV